MTRKLNSINRTATFAWSPGHSLPMIATGTKSGAMDDTFSNASELEIFKLDLNPDSKSLQTSFKVSTHSRFNTLAWGYTSTEKPNGIIAGGMESGELELWDPTTILENKSIDALILRNSTHTGTLRTLDFNLFQTNLLASAGSNAEVYIWDLNHPNTPYTPGAKSPKMDNISSVAWNGQVQHIVSTASTNGYTVVWDLRNKKEVMTLAHAGQSTFTGGRGSISSIAWHPNIATQIVTASDDDHQPIISLWDLRHAHSPEKTLAGHTKGVIDVSWCKQDSDLLISSGKDCKTLCWNPNSGELNGELYSNNKWTFGVDWCPRNPDLLASSSFDGSINILSIQGSQENNSDNPLVKTFELKEPPKWLRRPVGASFGFSGKLVTFNNNNIGQAIPDQPSSTINVKIRTIETDPEIVKRAEQLESATGSDVNALIEDRIQHSNKDKVDWEVLKTLFSDNAREQLMTYLGFEREQVAEAANALLLKTKKLEDTVQQLDINEDHTTPSTLFGESSLGGADDSFFGQISSQKSIQVSSSLLETMTPFNLYPTGSNETDHLITRAIVLGDFESAVNICLTSERYSDALILSMSGGSDLLARVQKVYFETQSKKFAYLRLLQGIMEEDLSSIVRDADLKEWASILVVLCTFAESKDFASLCQVLGDRLLKDSELSENATLFYLACGNLEKVSCIWISQFEKDDHVEDSYGVKLQELVEKVTIFRKAIEYEDDHATTDTGEYVLAPLYDKYYEYAEFMAAQGKLGVALKYISLTPPEYVASKSKIYPASVVHDRVFHASNNNQYPQPSFPFEKKLLSKEAVETPISVSTMQPLQTNYYASTTTLQRPQYSHTPIKLNHPQYVYGQYTNSTTPPPPPPKAASGAWNDPPMLASPKMNKKNPNAVPLNSNHAIPVKRVTTPFADSPIPQSSTTLPPQQPAMRPVQPPPSSNTTTGAFYSAYQQPQQFPPPQQRSTPPPPPMNAVAPSPMKRGGGFHHHS